MENKQERFEFLIGEEHQSTRIDLVLSLQLPEVSRNFIQKLLEKGAVRVLLIRMFIKSSRQRVFCLELFVILFFL